MSLNGYEDALIEVKRRSQWLSEISVETKNCLEEAGEELLTVHKLGIVGATRKSLNSTNLIESLLGAVRQHSGRVENWNGSADQRLRWFATAIQEHRKNMRKIQGCKLLPLVIARLNVETKKKVA